MDPQAEVNMVGYGDQGSLNEVHNGLVSGRIEGFNCPTEGSNFSDVLASNGGHYWDLPASKISDLMKLGSLENVATPSLFSVMNRILESCTERKNEDIPPRVASILKLVLQEIQQRVSKQAQNMRKQSTLYKSREERYQSKIRVLETLATGTAEENEVVLNQLYQMKIQKTEIEEMKKLEEQDLIKLRQEKDHCKSLILSLEEELKLAKKNYEENCFQLEAEAKETKDKLLKQIVELEQLLHDSRNKMKEIEDFSESKLLRWERKENGYRHFIDSQFESLKDLKLANEYVKQEVLKLKNIYAEEFFHFGLNLKDLIDAAQNYHSVLDENRKLYNEVQDLKGNIRVYCRVRPFLPGQSRKQTTIQYIGENGELVVTNPSKPGKDSHRAFKFNKVFGPASTQEEVFQDTQPLIRSVLDGYNVCIFAYGQTGSGKTYTMTGPNVTSVVDWGVNYRALNDLFNISQNRHSSIAYEVGVQMVEIYNEQVRDLLCNAGLQKRLGIWNTSQPNGLAVPDASMHPVRSTTDVLELMNIGLTNRAVGATALNERSSRSHSILTVHVRGTDLETNVVLRGCLHLVDLAGSERVHRSEATGDRLREAQHINKSLSALGDVISALAQKNPHVPYRNSKLTQVLQSSLGGQAKTLMFVQLNPDVESYSETISTLKFAERVSGVELGAAQSNKEGRGVRELVEQVAFLKDAVAKKDEEIGRLRLLKANGNCERIGINSPRRNSIEPPLQNQQLSGVKSSTEKVSSYLDHSSEYSDKHSDAGSLQSMDSFRHHKEFFQQSRLAIFGGGGENFPEDIGDADSEEKLSVTSDGVLSMGTETDASINNTADITQKLNVPIELPKPLTSAFSRLSLSKSSTKIPSSKRATLSSSSAMKLPKRFN